MITLYSSGPMFGLPHPSPFVIKADVLLKMSGLEYREAPMTFSGAPKGKVPYISDDGMVFGDSFFIRRHLETKYKIDYSGGYNAEKLALGWAIERMLEEHLYFLGVYERWLVDENFEKGPRQFFNMAPISGHGLKSRLIWNGCGADFSLRLQMPKLSFSTYPKPVRERLLALRQVIFDVARKTPGVGKLEEALRWGQPSYLTPETGSGSTIRIDHIKNEPTKYAMYFICTSGLVEDFKELYKDEMKFVGNRSIVFNVEDRLPEAALRHCISLALTYHLRKKQRAPKK